MQGCKVSMEWKLYYIRFGWKSGFRYSRPHILTVFSQFPPALSTPTLSLLQTGRASQSRDIGLFCSPLRHRDPIACPQSGGNPWEANPLNHNLTRFSDPWLQFFPMYCVNDISCHVANQPWVSALRVSWLFQQNKKWSSHNLKKTASALLWSLREGLEAFFCRSVGGGNLWDFAGSERASASF